MYKTKESTTVVGGDEMTPTQFDLICDGNENNQAESKELLKRTKMRTALYSHTI